MATGARDTAYANFYEVAKGSIGRARDGAQFIEKAAAGIAAAYGVALGVAFSVSDNPMPFRGMVPVVFLGLALVLASFYLAYPGQPKPIVADVPANAGPSKWFNVFADWMSSLTRYRGRFLRTALFALLFGVIFLPAPFVAVKTSPATPPAKTDWPDPGTNIALQKIRYQAEVDEVAKLREKAAPQPNGEFRIPESWIWWSALGALVVLALSMLFPIRRRTGDAVAGGGTPIHTVPYINTSDDTP